jgi:FeS assembly SUF system regulator
MIRLTNLADYAVVLMCHMANNRDNLFSAQDLSKITDLPVPTVSKILGALSRADLLISQRGLHGGFRLEKEPTDVSIGQIIEAIDGPIALVNCTDPDPNHCAISNTCELKARWKIINDAVKGAMDGVSLDAIAEVDSTLKIEQQLCGALGRTN